MAKKIEGYIKLNIPAGGANPSPPVGPALGQRGVNIMEFCKAFNATTDSLEKNMPIPVVITVYQDKSFTFTTKTAPVSFFLKKALHPLAICFRPRLVPYVATTIEKARLETHTFALTFNRANLRMGPSTVK